MGVDIFQAYAAILTMATSLVYIGSYSSLKKIKGDNYVKEDEDSDDEDDEGESLSAEDAYMFPIYGSGALFGIYTVLKYVKKEYLTYLIAAYFAIFGSVALTKLFNLVSKYTINSPFIPYKISLTQNTKELFKLKFDYINIGCFILSTIFTAGYTFSKNWMLNNLIGFSFSLSAIQLIQLDSFKTGMILLAGLFAYDVFWVFGTDVMVTVAKKFDGPIKLLWPKSLASGLLSTELKFTMLGLGDIVLPGIFVALCLAYDRHNAIQAAKAKAGPGGNSQEVKQLERNPLSVSFPKPYFQACFLAYILGLGTTIFVMHTFEAAQPALLYLSPACIIAPTLVALSQGKLTELFKFEATPEADKKKKEEASESSSNSATKVDGNSNLRQRNSKN